MNFIVTRGVGGLVHIFELHLAVRECYSIYCAVRGFVQLPGPECQGHWHTRV